MYIHTVVDNYGMAVDNYGMAVDNLCSCENTEGRVYDYGSKATYAHVMLYSSNTMGHS